MGLPCERARYAKTFPSVREDADPARATTKGIS
jgi:hypothetical protein